MSEHPMERIKRLADRLREEAEAIGLHLEQVAIFPNLEDAEGPTLLQGVFTIRPEAVTEPEVVDEAQIEFDKMFEGIIQGDKMDSEKEKLEGLAKDVQSWLEDK
jgi:hypothetical protein